MAALVLFGSSPAETREAQRLAHKSSLEYDVGHFDEALKDITRAYLLAPRPALLFNLGQCHRSLEHWKEAEFYYRNYLHKEPKASNRTVVLKLIDEMHARQQPPARRAARTQLVIEPADQPPPLVEAAPLAPAPLVVTAGPGPTAAPPSTAGTSAPKPVEAVPAAAVTASPTAASKRSHPRPLAYVFGVAALACAVVAVYGAVDVANFESVNNRVRNPTSYPQLQQDLATATADSAAAGNWQVAAFATGIAAVAGAAGTVLAW